MYIKFFIYTGEGEYFRDAVSRLQCSPEYPGGEVLEKLPEGESISRDVIIESFGFARHCYIAFVKDS